MGDRFFWLTDEHMLWLSPSCRKAQGIPQVDNGRVFSAVFIFREVPEQDGTIPELDDSAACALDYARLRVDGK